MRSLLIVATPYSHPLQGGEEAEDALSYRSLSATEPLIIGLLFNESRDMTFKTYTRSSHPLHGGEDAEDSISCKSVSLSTKESRLFLFPPKRVYYGALLRTITLKVRGLAGLCNLLYYGKLLITSSYAMIWLRLVGSLKT